MACNHKEQYISHRLFSKTCIYSANFSEVDCGSPKVQCILSAASCSCSHHYGHHASLTHRYHIACSPRHVCMWTHGLVFQVQAFLMHLSRNILDVSPCVTLCGEIELPTLQTPDSRVNISRFKSSLNISPNIQLEHCAMESKYQR